MRHGHCAGIALAAWTALILLVTLWPSQPGPSWLPAWVTVWPAEFLLNVALFVPFGALVTAVGARWWWAPVLGLALSLAVEFAQTFLPERFPAPADLLANALGALAGAGVAAWLGARVGRPRHS